MADSAEFDAVIATWAPNRAASWLHRTEMSWRHVLVAIVVLIAVGWAAIHFGLPWAARKVAFLLPTGLTTTLTDQTLATLDATMLAPTRLTHARQNELQAKFRTFLDAVGDRTPYRIEFRVMKGDVPNAFALPAGVIVITDALVHLAEDDREIVAVLAHECGHIRHRHTLRAVLQNSAVFVVLALATGDVSSATALGSALPAFLLQSRFSRDFEREADAHAVAELRRGGLEPAHLARILGRLAATHSEGDSKVMGYLRTHPPTPERIESIQGKR